MADPTRTALVYDFDGTLATGNMQEHSFIPATGVSTAEFWGDVKRLTREHNVDEILVYMWRMLARARENGLRVTKQMLMEHGRELPFFAGVETWFDRINSYGLELGLEIEHYIISSGIFEMIRGCSIYPYFKYVFASKFIYQNDEAVWPGTGINYTNKTQHLFRINKGIENIWDNTLINRWIPNDLRPVPFERIIFVGDGETDIPAMKMVRHQGGHSIAVFDPDKLMTEKGREVLYNLIAEDRVHFVAPADYREGSQLDVTIKGVLGRIARGVRRV